MGMENFFRQGEHICSVYETEEEQLATAAAYLADGLRAGERAFYVGESPASLTRFDSALTRAGIDPVSAVQSGALIESTNADAHLAHGTFNCERMLLLLNKAVESALNDGFAGLRTCGDMSWLLVDPAGAQHMVEYEALLNEFFQSVRGAGMCQYDRHRLPGHLMDHGLATHTSVLIDGHHKSNPFYRPRDIAVRRQANPFNLNWKLTVLRSRR
jgi:hypothetical protein